jgi:hypothetical protein
MITIDILKELPATPAPEVSEPAPTPATFPTRIVSRPKEKETVKESPKKPVNSEVTPQREEVVEKKETFAVATPVAAPGTGKKNRRKGTQSEPTPGAAQSSKTIVLDPSSNVRNGSLGKSNAKTALEASSSAEISDASLKNIEARVSGEVKKLFGDSLDSLRQNIKDDRRAQAASAEAKQDAMLRLVSATLSDNIEVTLGRIVDTSIQQSVLPVIAEVTAKVVEEQLSVKLNSHIAETLPKEIKKNIPDAIDQALRQPQLLKLMSESLAKSVSFRVEEQFASLLQNVVTPAFSKLAIQSSQKVAADLQREATQHIEGLQRQRHADSVKIEQLTQLVTGLTQTVSSMASAQAEFQAQFLKMQQQAAIDRRDAAARQSQSEGHGHTSHNSTSRSSTALTGPVEVEKSASDIEYETMLRSISAAMNEGEFENAVIQWLQTRREQEFFQNFFSRYNPDFIRELSPLLLLSLGATITLEMNDELLPQRVAWLETILGSFQGHINRGNVVSCFDPFEYTVLTSFRRTKFVNSFLRSRAFTFNVSNIYLCVSANNPLMILYSRSSLYS